MQVERLVSGNPKPALSGDAAFVLAMARHALAYADCPVAEAERWLRILRVHGHAGSALQALGVGEAPLAERPPHRPVVPPARATHAAEAVDAIERSARVHARTRGAELVSTVDLTVVLMAAYEGAIEEALRLRGTSRAELLERLPLRSFAV